MKKDVKQKLLELSKISLWVDNYNDIFSDFDSRSYEQRALSDDFLLEAKKASRDKVSGTIELNLLVPKRKRNSHHKLTIKKRLRDHFKKYHAHFKKEINKVIQQGAAFLVLGTILMLISTFILFEHSNSSLILDFLVVILQPAGWFLFWEGLNLIIFESKHKRPELDFYRKMSSCEVHFMSC